MPLADRLSLCWMVGAAIATMVWSMKVIATAKIIAVRIRLRDRPPVPVVLLWLIMFLLGRGRLSSGAPVRGAGIRALGSHQRVGQGVDAGQAGGEVVAGGQCARCVVRDLG